MFSLKRVYELMPNPLLPSPKKVRVEPQELPDLLHPYQILEHIVRVIVPESWCDSVRKRKLYQDIKDAPDVAIQRCKELVRDWVVEQYEAGQSYDHDKLRKIAVKKFSSEPGIYVSCMRIPPHLYDDKYDNVWRRYSGQAKDCEQRVHKQHENPAYRMTHPSLHYEYYELAEEIFWLNPASTPLDLPQGLTNIMEMWMSLVFRSLGQSDLRFWLPDAALVGIPYSALNCGMNVRLPLAQGLPITESPCAGYHRFKRSTDPIKQAFYNRMVTRASPEEKIFWSDEQAYRELLFRGDIFPGSIHDAYAWRPENKGLDKELTIGSAWIRFDATTYRRWNPQTIRVRCELAPEGEKHPHCIAWGRLSNEDPVRRLAIRISGIMKCNGVESFCWVGMWGDKTAMRLNTLVDWLEGRPTELSDPRRYIPKSVSQGRPKGIYTTTAQLDDVQDDTDLRERT